MTIRDALKYVDSLGKSTRPYGHYDVEDTMDGAYKDPHEAFLARLVFNFFTDVRGLTDPQVTILLEKSIQKEALQGVTIRQLDSKQNLWELPGVNDVHSFHEYGNMPTEEYFIALSREDDQLTLNWQRAPRE